ncbi:hypothetical protein ACMYSQ_000032 [Aspergillus niger]|nr:hypothetical protein AnigIFM63326_001668 [Aspergillus niger]
MLIGKNQQFVPSCTADLLVGHRQFEKAEGEADRLSEVSANPRGCNHQQVGVSIQIIVYRGQASPGGPETETRQTQSTAELQLNGLVREDQQSQYEEHCNVLVSVTGDTWLERRYLSDLFVPIIATPNLMVVVVYHSVAVISDRS